MKLNLVTFDLITTTLLKGYMYHKLTAIGIMGTVYLHAMHQRLRCIKPHLHVSHLHGHCREGGGRINVGDLFYSSLVNDAWFSFIVLTTWKKLHKCGSFSCLTQLDLFGRWKGFCPTNWVSVLWLHIVKKRYVNTDNVTDMTLFCFILYCFILVRNFLSNSQIHEDFSSQQFIFIWQFCLAKHVTLPDS